MTKHRRHFKQTRSLEARLSAEADRLREKAKGASSGIEREELLRKAEQCETGLHVSEWLRSPGLRMPGG